MDALSKILDMINLKGVLYQKSDYAPPWGIAVPQGQFALFRMVLKGRCFVTMDNDTVIELNEGDLILFPHSAAYSIADKPDTKCISETEFAKSIQNGMHLSNGKEETTTLISGRLEFDTTCLHPFIKNLPEVIHIKKAQIKEPDWLAQITRLIVAETANEKMGSKVLLNRLSEVLIIHTIRAYVEQNTNKDGFLSALQEERISQALQLMHESPEKDWTLDLLSKQVGMSRTLFCNRFKGLVGETPLMYLTNWRILRARQLLLNSKESISEIASQVGYQSEAAFNRIFKSKNNQTPASYRRRRTATETSRESVNNSTA